MSRARLYVLIDAFEHDMRDIVERYVLDHLLEAEALGSDFVAADSLRAADAGDEKVSIVHYLFLRQCYDILNRNREALPEELGAELRSNTAQMDILVPVRNRVMHGRPLKVDDPERAVSALQGFTSRHWPSTKETLNRLATDPTWEPAFESLPLPTERVLHNLPQADYDETGLIGRGDDVNKLKSLLLKRRESIITITGEGGIGKTALALEVAYAIVDDPDSVFDCVLWVSLKTEMLTAYGVRAISNAVRDITGATQSLGKVMDRSFNGSAEDLSEMLQGITALIVIDNLESAQGDEVVRLYDALPDTVSFLFTSRVGIGQIERRYPLGALGKTDAARLFRKFAATRGQTQLVRLGQRTLDEVLTRLRSSPLALRWYILSVETGKEPLGTLRNQNELLDFCVRNVYAALSPTSQRTLSVLRALDRSVSFDELAVLTDMPIDDLRRAAQELSRGSLVTHEPDRDGGLASRLSLSATARTFLPLQGDDGLAASEILQREQDYVRGAERRRMEEASGRLGPNVVRVRGPEDEPTAHLLRIALSLSKRGDAENAQSYIDRARALNPDFWEVDRVDGFIASTVRQRERAASLYRAALSNADGEEARAVVCHYLAGHLARGMHEQELALPYAQEAHSVLKASATAIALGNLLIWNGQFPEGLELLESALEDAEGKSKVIALTGLSEGWRRWAESLYEQHFFLDAFEKSIAGFKVGADAIRKGLLDLRLAAVVMESATAAFRAGCQPGLPPHETELLLLDVLRFLDRQTTLFRATKEREMFAFSLSRWLQERRAEPEAAELGSKVLARICGNSGQVTKSTEEEADDEDPLIGEIISWSGRYGFIKHPDYPNNVFFHRGALAPSVRDSSIASGALVTFRTAIDKERDKPRATSIALFTPSME